MFTRIWKAISLNSTRAIIRQTMCTVCLSRTKKYLMKDENNGVIMTEFVGLRAKMYAVRMDGKDTKKAKSVKNNRSANDNVRWLHAVFEWRDRNDSSSPYDLNYTKCTRYPNWKSLWVHTTTNDSSYQIWRRLYRGSIGRYLCNICYYYVL